MPLFDIPQRPGREKDSDIVKKSKRKPTSPTKVRTGGVSDTISQIVALVSKNLGKYEEESLLIRDMGTLHNYVDRCIENGVVSIDTETEGWLV